MSRQDWGEDQLQTLSFPVRQLVLLSILLVIGALFATEAMVVEVWIEKLAEFLEQRPQGAFGPTTSVVVVAVHMLLVLVVEEECLGTPVADALDWALDAIVIAFWQQVWWSALDADIRWSRATRMVTDWLRGWSLPRWSPRCLSS